MPGRCGTGAAQAPGTCATSRPVPVPGAAPASFLAGISSETGYMHLAFVSPEAHTPLAQFLVVWWPFLVLALVVVLFARRVSFAGFLASCL